MDVFVTGGSGFVGRPLIKALKSAGYSVKALARSSASAVKVEASGADAVRGDLLDIASLREGLKGVEAVVHSAAHLEMAGRYAPFYLNNVTGTENMLAAAKAAGVRRFVHIGAAPVIKGDGPVHMADESWAMTEPAYSPYIATKSLAEQRVRAANADGFTTIALRPPLIWGPDHSMLPAMTERIEKGQWRWMGGGTFPYVACHVRNVCEGVLCALEHGRGGEAYNLTDGAPFILKEFLSRVLETQGVDAGDKSIPFGVAYAAAGVIDRVWNLFGLTSEPPISRTLVRLMGEEFTVSDRKAREELGYRGKVSFEEGLAELEQAAADARRGSPAMTSEVRHV